MATIRDYLQDKASIVRDSGDNVYIQCPGCNTRQAKCAVHIRRGIGNCFRASCPLNGGFNFPHLITIIEGCTYSRAITIAAQYNEGLDREYKARSYGTNRDYPRNSLPIDELVHSSNKQLQFDVAHAVTYLANTRGLTEKQIVNYHIGLGTEDFLLGQDVPEKHRFVPRHGMIVIPILFNDEIVSYIERSVVLPGNVEMGRRTHHSATEYENYLTKGQTLFNCDVAIPAAKRNGYLPLFEDAWSAIKLCGVATLGSSISEDQLYILLNNYDGPIVICRDNDKGGHEAATKDKALLSRYYSDIRQYVPRAVDPDDDVEGTRQGLKNAQRIDIFEDRLRGLLS